MIHPSYVDPFDVDAIEDVRAEAAAEAAYERAERAGMRLDSLLCAECHDPALCAAERECALDAHDGFHAAELAAWDDPEALS